MRKILLVLIILCIALSGCGKSYLKEEDLKIPVSRAHGIKTVSVCLFGENSDTLSEDTLPYEDVKESDWFYPYIKKMYSQKLLLDSSSLNPNAPLTLEEGTALLSHINSDYSKKIKLTEKNKKSPISMEVWTKLISEACNEEMSSIYIFSADENNVCTDKGIFLSEGIDFSLFSDKELSVIIKGGKILGIEKILSEKAVLENVFIKSKGLGLEVSLNGKSRIFSYKDKISSPIGTVYLNKGEIEKIIFPEGSFSGTVKKAGDTINIDDRVYDISPETSFFTVKDGSLYQTDFSEICCGDFAEIYFTANTLNSLIITKKASPEILRVVLKNTDYKDYFHEIVSIEGDALVKYGQKEKLISGKTDLSDFFNDSERIYVYPKEEKIKVSSITRASGNPSYRGNLEIEKTKEGYIIINNVSMEDYICGVIPSEMSSDFGLTALKVQALCARSFAYNGFYENKFSKYGGNLDDSTASQVYNNYPETPLSIQAAKETEGECIVFENTVISANFFSTSCGVTADSGDVWILENNKTPLYLSGTKLYYGEEKDLSDESEAKLFFKSKEISALESECPWFRWETEIPLNVLEKNLPERLRSISSENPAYVQGEKDFNLGKIKNIYISERGKNGNVRQIVIEGELSSIKVKSEYAVRKVLSPSNSEDINPIILKDNSNTKYKNYPLLPSGFFVTENVCDKENNFVSIKIYGGGFGHGAGLSQNGAKALSEKGLSYEEIIEYFYKGASIKKVI